MEYLALIFIRKYLICNHLCIHMVRKQKYFIIIILNNNRRLKKLLYKFVQIYLNIFGF